MLLSTSVGFAQQRLFLKPVVGVNYISTKADSMDQRKQYLGLNVGLGGEHKINAHLSIDAVLTYSYFKNQIYRDFKLGGALQGPLLQKIGFIETTRYHFLKLPINLLYKQDKASSFYACVGVGIAYNITSNRNSVSEIPDFPQQKDERDDRVYLDNELTGRFGAFGVAAIGKEWKISNFAIGCKIEYSIDITRWKYAMVNFLEGQNPYLVRTSGFSFNVYTLL